MDSDKERSEWDVLHRRLRTLPDRKAPPALAGRVRQAIEARSRLHWWQRPLPEWPRFWRLLACLLGTTLAAGLVWLGAAVLGEMMGTAGQWIETALNPVLGIAGQVISIFTKTAAVFLGRVSGGMWIAAGLAGVLVYASGIGIGTLFWKVAKAGHRQDPC